MTAPWCCSECADMLARIRMANAAEASRPARAMTEPERRRAAGERPFIESEHAAVMARFLTQSASLEPAIASVGDGLYAREMVAVQLRALVLQELCDLLGVT